jgi:hypothetical protein
VDLLQAALFPAFVLLMAGGLVWSHVRTWSALKLEKERLVRANVDQADAAAADYDYRYRQCRRRLQASSLLGLVGVALFVGQLIDFRKNPSFFVFFWCAVALLVLWIVLLALADVFATRMRNLRLSQERLIENAKLQARIRKAKERLRDGAELGPTAPPQSAHHQPGRNGDASCSEP